MYETRPFLHVQENMRCEKQEMHTKRHMHTTRQAVQLCVFEGLHCMCEDHAHMPVSTHSRYGVCSEVPEDLYEGCCMRDEVCGGLPEQVHSIHRQVQAGLRSLSGGCREASLLGYVQQLEELREQQC
jgi:hypothetical protein